MLTIKKLRAKIDKIDADIIKKLSQRKTLSVKIGKLKSSFDGKIIDREREKKLIIRYEKLCAEYQLQPALVKKLFKIILADSRKLQKTRSIKTLLRFL
jgi:chorismate mutase